MAKERVSTYRNTGTPDAPTWEKYFVKTLAECILMSDADNETKTIKDYVDETVSSLVNGAPEAYDTLKELADAITENESVVEAINAAITNKAEKSELLYSNATPTVQEHGGIAAGSTFENVSITDMLTKILYPWVAPTVTAKVVTPSNGGVFEKGDTQTVTSISVTVTKKSSNIVSVGVYDGSTNLGLIAITPYNNAVNTSGAAITFNFTPNDTTTKKVNVSTNKTFSASVTDADGKVTSANTGTFSFVYPYYYGVIAADATADAAAVKALTKLVQAKGTKAVSYTASDQKMVFATPTANGVIKTITDPNGFNVTDTFTQSTVSITGLDGTAQNYYVYVSDATTVSAFKMTFAH